MDSELDYSIKSELLINTFQLLNVSVVERKYVKRREQMDSQLRIYGELFAPPTVTTTATAATTTRKKSNKHNNNNSNNRNNNNNNSYNKYSYNSERDYWLSYLENEKRYLGKFDLILSQSINSRSSILMFVCLVSTTSK